MKTTYVIQIDSNDNWEDDWTYGGFIKVLNVDSDCHTDFQYTNDYEILYEDQDSDCEDFNDNARWLAKTMLTIMKMEANDDTAHCDWSADIDHDKQTGKYKFNVELKRIEND